MVTRICLPRAERDRVLSALKSKELSLDDLYTMPSEKRRAAFSKYLPDDQARLVNAKFEQAMLSSQNDAMARWVKSTVSPKDPIRKDMLKRIQRNKKALSTAETEGFLTDLVEDKLRVSVSKEEAKTILKLTKAVEDARAIVDMDSPMGSESRMVYGFAADDFKQYVIDLQKDAMDLTLKERISLPQWRRNMVDMAGTAKAMKATFDNSFLGRQGIKALYNGQYKVWFNGVKESFDLIGKEMTAKAPKGMFKGRNDAALRTLRAEIISRPNALNGKYNAAKNGYGLNVLHEEAYPTSVVEKLPFFGRLFKASESAFSGTAMRMRADLADAVIKNAEKNGVDMLDEKQATAFGNIVTSLTGRGGLGRAESVGRDLNVMFFSPKFFVANLQTLTAHTFDASMTPQAKKLAATNLLRIAGSIGGLLATAKMIDPDSVDFDPRSTRFGKIKIGKRWVDITGGMAGIAVLVARLMPTQHEGQWGTWTKTSTGKYIRTNANKFGVQNGVDQISGFISGKLAPVPAAIRDTLTGRNYDGDKVTPGNTLRNLTVPITPDNVIKDLQSGRDDTLLAFLFEFIGLSNSPSELFVSGEKWDALKEKSGPKVYLEAQGAFTDMFEEKVKKFQLSSRWDRLDNDERNKEIDKIRRESTDRILRKYGMI